MDLEALGQQERDDGRDRGDRPLEGPAVARTGVRDRTVVEQDERPPPRGLLVVGSSHPIRDLDLMAVAHPVGERRVEQAD